MAAVDVRNNIARYLDQVEDESFLKVVESMLDTYVRENADPVVAYDIDGTPRTASELASMLDAELEAARKGNFVTIDEFRKVSAQWGQSTK